MRYTQKHIDLMLRVVRKDGISVIITEQHPLRSHSNCRSSNPCITLGIEGDKWLILSALIHEYGHILSIRQGTKLKMSTVMMSRMGIVLSKRDAMALIQEERQAWKLGFKSLQDNGIVVDEDLRRNREILIGRETRRIFGLVE